MSVEFLKKILPSKGLYCVARALGHGFDQSFHHTVDEAYVKAQAIDKTGQTVFIAQANFTLPGSRRQDNVISVRSFWFDIDCGEGKPYASQTDGLFALKQFIEKADLPMPSVVISGRGLYSYWSMENDISPSQWRGVARILKKLCGELGFQADPARTSDTSSVLRPPGVHHRKDESNSILVRILNDRPPHDFDEFAKRVHDAAKKFKIDSNLLAPPKMRGDLNSEFTSGLEGPPCFSEKIAAKCSQVGMLIRNNGDVPEPLWYALIGLLRYAVDGEEFIHKWSSGYSDYSQQETQAKINQHNAGPTTCEYISNVSPGGCVGCASSGKIKTPLVLGREFKTVTVEDERVGIPEPFKLTENGIIRDDGDGDVVQVYPYDLYPTKIAYDESLGYETVTIRHKQPHHGWKEFAFRSALTHDPRSFLMNLADNHVQVSSAESKKNMVIFMEAYLQKLRAHQKMTRLFTQMGWKGQDEEASFVLGSKVFTKGQVPQLAGFARNVPQSAEAFSTKGDIHEWINATKSLDVYGAEGHIFALLVAAFGSPLLRFTGFNGALICCLGESGIGKTLMAKWALSVYGSPADLMLYERDTMNSRISRLGLYGSLPVCIDEFTNIDEKSLSDFAFAVTQGRDKNRLGRDAREKASINHWQTLSMVSTNMSIVEKLARLKGDASPELNRVFEYTMREIPDMDRADLTGFHRAINENYGYVGELYIQYLVDNYEHHQGRIDALVNKIEQETQASPSERFWVNVAGVALYGGMIANKLGITSFDLNRLYKWTVERIREMKGVKQDAVTNGFDFVGDFLDRNAGKILIACGTPQKKNVVPARVPVGEVVGLYLTDVGILYISRSAARNFCKEAGLSANAVRDELRHTQPKPILMHIDYRKALSHGVSTLSGSPVPCWVLDMKHPKMSRNVVSLVGAPQQEGEDMRCAQ